MPLTKRHVITHVTFVTMRILENSYLYGTSLWPKNGVMVPANSNMDKNDIIEVRPLRVEITQNDVATGILRLNMFNKIYPRVLKQFPHLELIIDCAILDDVLFEFKEKGTIGMGLDRHTFGHMNFKFTYTHNQ